MKRNILRCLCPLMAFIMIFTYAVQPVSAAQGNFIEILDYDSVTDQGNFFYFSNSYNVKLDLVNESFLYYIDLLFTSSSSITGISSLRSGVKTPLTIVSLGNNLYRAYAALSGYNYQDVSLEFVGNGTEYITLLSCRVSTIPTVKYNVSSTVDITNLDGTSGTLNFTGSSVQYVKVPTDVSLNTQFISYIKFNPTSEWKKFDFWEVQLYMQVGDINSIAAVMGENILPVQYNFLNDANVSVSDYYVTVQVDLRDLDRTVDDYPMIMITGNYHLGQNRIGMFNSCGSVESNNIDPQFYYFRNLENLLTSISSFIQSHLPAIQNGLSSIDIHLENFYSEFSDYVEIFIDRINILDDIYLSIENIFGRIGDVITHILSSTVQIIDAIKGDSKDTEELDQSSSQIRDDVSDVHQFEQDQQAVLDNNFTVIQNAVTVTSFAAALAFVQGYANHMFVGLGNVKLIFTLPLFLGLFFYVCSRIPGATRWKSSPPSSGRSPTGTKASGKGGSSK